MTPQLRPEIRPKTRLGGHSAAGPRSPKRRIKSRNRVTSACHVVGRVDRNSGGLRPLPLGHGITWIASQLRGACASGPVAGPVSSSPRPLRRSQLTWQTISGAVKRPQSGLRSGLKRPTRSRTASRTLVSKSVGMAAVRLFDPHDHRVWSYQVPNVRFLEPDRSHPTHTPLLP